MLDTVTLECFRAAIVHMHGEGYSDGALGHHQALAMALRNLQVISDDPKLLARHLKNVVFVDAQGGTHRFGGAGNSAWKPAICAGSGPSSNRILRADGSGGHHRRRLCPPSGTCCHKPPRQDRKKLPTSVPPA